MTHTHSHSLTRSGVHTTRRRGGTQRRAWCSWGWGRLLFVGMQCASFQASRFRSRAVPAMRSCVPTRLRTTPAWPVPGGQRHGLLRVNGVAHRVERVGGISASWTSFTPRIGVLALEREGSMARSSSEGAGRLVRRLAPGAITSPPPPPQRGSRSLRHSFCAAARYMREMVPSHTALVTGPGSRRQEVRAIGPASDPSVRRPSFPCAASTPPTIRSALGTAGSRSVAGAADR